MKRPFVFINMATTADGKIATVNREVSSFGSRRDFEHLLQLRATADAVISGANTVNAGNVNLGPGPAKFRRLRIRRGLAECNMRIIVSGSGTINSNAEIFRHRFSPIIVLTTGSIGARRLNQLRAVTDEVKICGRHELDFAGAFSWLRKKWGIQRLLCEGGGELNGALFHAGLVDELHLTICPKIFGGSNAPTIADGIGFLSLVGASQLSITSRRRVGDELFVVYDVLR